MKKFKKKYLPFFKKLMVMLIIQTFLYATVPLPVGANPNVADFPNSPTQMSGFPNYQSDPSDGLQTISPAENILELEGLDSNSFGSAQFSLPLILPPGRQEMMPPLSINYGSDSENGWLGVDFSITIPMVTIDTRFGVPSYDGQDRYLLNGSQLIEVDTIGDTTTYRERVEGAFQRIERIGTNPSNYRFEITDKLGIKSIYGVNSAVLRSYRNINGTQPIYMWYLSQTVDPNGNTIRYEYTVDTNTTGVGEDWRMLYLSTIRYTGHTSGEMGNYTVHFLNDPQVRQDIISDARGRFQMKTRFRLQEIQIKYKNDLIRKYRLDYIYGDFGKSKISSIRELDAAGNEFYAYSFDYYRMPTKNGGFDGFQSVEKWNNAERNISENQTFSGGAEIFAGVGPSGNGENSIGAGINFQYERGNDLATFLDIDGDGLPDQIFQDSAGSPIGYRLNTGSSFSPFQNLTSLGGQMNSDEQFDIGFKFSVGLAALQANIGGNFSFNKGLTSLEDINGDGFIDFIPGAGDSVFKQGSGLGGFVSTPWTIPGGALNLDLDMGISDLEEMEDLEAAYHPLDAVRKWKPYHAGTILLTSEIEKTDNGDGISDGVEVNLYKEAQSLFTNPVVLNEGAQTTHSFQESIEITLDEAIYFQVNAVDGINNDTIVWDAEITYTAIQFHDDMEGYFLSSQPYPYNGNTYPVFQEGNRFYIEVSHGTQSFRVYSDTSYPVTQAPYAPGIQEAVVIDATTENTGNQIKTSFILLDDFDTNGDLISVRQYLHVFDAATDFNVTDIRDAAGLTDEFFGGGVYNWYYGEWNGALSWDPTLIGAEPENEDDPIPFVSMSALEANDAQNPTGEDLWKGTETSYKDRSVDSNGDVVEVQKFFASLVSFGEMTPSKKGGDATENIPTGEISIQAGGISVLPKSFNYSINAGGGVAGIPAPTINFSKSKTYVELIDMNGDQYPDQLLSSVDNGTMTAIQNVGGTGYGKTAVYEGFGNIRESITQVYGGGYNPGGTGSDIEIRQTPEGEIISASSDNASYGPAPSFNWSLGENITQTDLIDINGDGLPDHIQRDSEQEYRVRLNLGDGFGVEESFSTAGFDDAPLQSDLIDLLMTVNSAVSGFPDNGADSVRYTNTVSGGVNISFGADKVNANGSLTLSGSRTKSDLVDMNGDGLVDQVFKLNRNDYFLVRFNYGDHFGPVVQWFTPGWTIDGDNFQIDNFASAIIQQVAEELFAKNGADDIDTSAINIDFSAIEGIAGDLAEDLNILGAGDVINWNGSFSASVGLGGTVEIPLGPTGFSVYVSPSGNFAYSLSSAQLQMSDVDGDNLPDHIFKYGLDEFFRVKLNNAKKVGLLKTIHSPLGSVTHLDYDRIRHSVTSPNHQYVLAEVTHEDGMGNSYGVRYDYFDSGFYDRSEREFYGFAQVREIYTDQTYRDQFFHNQDFYRKGLMVLEERRDASDRIMFQSEHEYELVLVDVGSKPVYFPANTLNTERFYDLNNPQELPKAQQTLFEYDQYGNIVEVFDRADIEFLDDDNFTFTAYYQDLDNYIVANPSSNKVTDASGVTFRQQFHTYDARGNLLETQHLLNTSLTNPIYSFRYDQYGNMVEQTDPSGFQITYEYDTENHTYPTFTNDSFGHITTAEYDFQFGVNLVSTDPNGNTTLSEYDSVGRLTKVWSPYDDPLTGIPSVEYQYFTDSFPLRAVTKNKQHFDPTNSKTIDVVTIIDGLDRPLQTKTEADVDLGGNEQYGMIVSGNTEYDNMGRVKRQGQPVFEAGYNLSLSTIPTKNPVVSSYDALGRLITEELPDGEEIHTEYSIDTRLFKTLTIDPLGNKTAHYQDVYTNIRQVEEILQGTPLLTTYAYNVLSELVEITDDQGHLTNIEYDTMGRQISVTNPDRGLQEFRYDLLGNLVEKIDANLREKSQSIQYEYDFFRLRKIDYPESPDVEFTYGDVGATDNRVGEVASVTDASGITELYYGKLGDITKVEKTLNFLVPGHAPEMFTNEYRYDYMGRIEWQRFPDNEEIFYQFDEGGMMDSVYGIHKGARFDYVKQSGYDEFGQKVFVQFGNDVETRYTYDPHRRWVDAIQTNTASGTTFQDFTYQRDAVGNILLAQNQGEKQSEQTYQYDDLYRLVSAEGFYQAPKPNFTSYYQQNLNYDTIGNIIQKTSVGIENPGNRDIKDLSYDLVYQMDAQRPHQASYIGDHFYEYDGNGNLIGVYLDRSLSSNGNAGGNSNNSNGKKNGHNNPNNPHSGNGNSSGSSQLDLEETYVWDEDNRLMQVQFEGRTVDFLYDASGRRTVKRGQQGEVLYVEDTFQIQNGNEVTKHIFVGDTKVVSKISKFQENGSLNFEQKNVHFYHPDHLGSTSFVSLPDGDEWEHTEYTPYGETWVDEVTNSNKIRWFFNSKELDESTGFYYYGARYYHQKTGRWVSPDPAFVDYLPDQDNDGILPAGGVFTPVNLALYHYAANNPINFVDPDGREDIVLGLNSEIGFFHSNLGNQGIKAYFYNDWEDAGIISPGTSVDSDAFFDQGGAFDQALKNADNIHFTIEGFTGDTREEMLREAYQKGLQENGMTNRELYRVLSSDEAFDKTTFYVYDKGQDKFVELDKNQVREAAGASRNRGAAADPDSAQSSQDNDTRRSRSLTRQQNTNRGPRSEAPQRNSQRGSSPPSPSKASN